MNKLAPVSLQLRLSVEGTVFCIVRKGQTCRDPKRKVPVSSVSKESNPKLGWSAWLELGGDGKWDTERLKRMGSRS